jgi:hypothetical protein
VEPVPNDAPLGANSVEADEADPRPNDDAGGLPHDLVVHGVGPGMPVCTGPGDVAPPPRVLGCHGSGGS